MTVKELKILINALPDETPVVIETHIKTGYDEGNIFHSMEIIVTTNRNTVKLEAAGQKLVGGW